MSLFRNYEIQRGNLEIPQTADYTPIIILYRTDVYG